MIFKLKTYGIHGKLLKSLENYLTDCQQWVVLNGKTSSWQNIYVGVRKGSVPGPLLLLIYINDLLAGLTSMSKIFADDTVYFQKWMTKAIQTPNLTMTLQK